MLSLKGAKDGPRQFLLCDNPGLGLIVCQKKSQIQIFDVQFQLFETQLFPNTK